MTTENKNYTKEQEASMIAEYKMNPTRATVDVIAEDLGKSVKSVIAKLVTLKVYVKAVKTTKTGKPVIRKTALVEKINSHFGFEMPSLAKATKIDLQNMVDNLSWIKRAEMPKPKWDSFSFGGADFFGVAFPTIPYYSILSPLVNNYLEI